MGNLHKFLGVIITSLADFIIIVNTGKGLEFKK